MKILDEKLLFYLKKQNRFNWLYFFLMTLVYIILIVLLVVFQTRALENLFIFLCTAISCLYVWLVWMFIYCSIIPINKYCRLINIYLKNVHPQKIIVRFLQSKENIETINRIQCHFYLFDIVDENKNISLGMEKDLDYQFEPDVLYEISYYQQFIGEIKKI